MTVRYVTETDVNASDSAATPDSEARQSTREELGRYADQGGFAMTTETHPWLEAAEAVTSPEDARAASTVLAELRSRDIRAIGSAATGIAAKAALDVPETLAGLRLLVSVLQRVQQTAATLQTEAYEADLHALTAATGTGRYRKQQGVKLSWNRRRALRAHARRLAIGRLSRTDLHAALADAVTAHADWTALATDKGAAIRPVVPVDGELLAETAQAVEALGEAVNSLGRLLTERALESQPLGELADLVDRLAADEGTLYRLSALRNLREALAAEDLAELLDELTERQADRDAALSAYDRHVGAPDAEDAARSALAAGPRTAEPAAEAESPAAEAVSVVEEAIAEAELVSEPESTEAAAEAEVEPAEIDSVVVAEELALGETAAEAEVEAVAGESVEVVTEPVLADEAAPAELIDEDAVAAEPEQVVEPEELAVVEPAAEAEVEAAVAEPAELIAESVVAVEAEPAEPVVEPVVETEVEAVAAESVELLTEPVVADEATSAEDIVAVDEPAAAGEAVEAEPAAEVAVVKPDITPGRPITAYEPTELVALVRWLDADGSERSEDDLLRAAMKELGFARLGPRIKDALGAAVAEVRA